MPPSTLPWRTGGWLDTAVARKLTLSRTTVGTHVPLVLTKLGFTPGWRPHPSRRAITCSRTVPGAPAIKGNRRRCCVVDKGTRPARRAGEQTAMGGTWLRFLRWSGTACAVVTAAVLAAASTGCSAGPAPGREAEHGPRRAVLTTTFQLPGVAGVATGDGAAWVTTGNAVLRINPHTDRASQFLGDPGASLTGVAFGAGSLWVEGNAGILRVD